jgi:hypothetical protein
MKLSLILLYALTLSGCAIGHIAIVQPTGTRTDAWFAKLGDDESFHNLFVSDGIWSLTLGAAESNQTKGLETANSLIGTVGGAAVSAVVKGLGVP